MTARRRRENWYTLANVVAVGVATGMSGDHQALRKLGESLGITSSVGPFRQIQNALKGIARIRQREKREAEKAKAKAETKAED